MKTFVAYALIIVGLPHAIGLLVGLPFGRLACRLAPLGQGYKALSIVDILNGLGCFAAGFLLFRLLSLQITLALPVILGLRSAVYFFPKQQFLMGICHFSGICGGWIAYYFLKT